MQTGTGITNAEYAAAENSTFQKACERAGVKATRRQASKYRNQKGAAYKARKETK